MNVKLRGCEYREGILYDPEAGIWGKDEGHLWRVGAAPLLTWLSGGFTSVSLSPPGYRAAAGRVFGSVEGPKHFEVVRAPFDCVVRETNARVLSEPRLANRDPFGEGWLAVLEKGGGESSLLPLGEAAAAIEAKLVSLGVRCFAEFPDVEMYEIGVECSAAMAKLSEEIGRSPEGTVIHLVSDDPTAEVEMARWEDQTGNSVLETRVEGGLRHFVVKKN